jgi:hypothetical protein
MSSGNFWSSVPRQATLVPQARMPDARGPTVTTDCFSDVSGRIPFGGLEARDPLAYRVYDADRLVLGRRMEDHLRVAVCLWHSFASSGSDVFGSGTFDQPWLRAGLDPLAAGRANLDAPSDSSRSWASRSTADQGLACGAARRVARRVARRATVPLASATPRRRRIDGGPPEPCRPDGHRSIRPSM